MRPPIRILAVGLIVLLTIAIILNLRAAHQRSAPQYAAVPNEAAPISSGCRAAMQHAANDGHGIDVSLTVINADDDRTITACTSANEWLTAVQDFIGPGDHNMISNDGLDPPDPSGLLSTICQTTKLVHAPACNGNGP